MPVDTTKLKITLNEIQAQIVAHASEDFTIGQLRTIMDKIELSIRRYVNSMDTGDK